MTPLFKETGFNQIKTKTTELVIVRAGPVEIILNDTIVRGIEI
jgi:hypothetical protein